MSFSHSTALQAPTALQATHSAYEYYGIEEGDFGPRRFPF